MKKLKAFRWAAIAAVIAGPLTGAMATNGYFSHGYGMKSKGMGGAAVAMTDNAFAGANNPAAAAWAGNRAEVGLDLFMPERSAEIMGNAVKSDSNLFYVPELGYNRAVSDKVGAGITIYGNGGMNTDYPASPFLNPTSRFGVDLSQLIIAPTVGYKLSDKHSVGVSPLLVYQQFKTQGMGPLDAGYDSSTGFGLRLGYLGKLNEKIDVGVSYSPKVVMTKFDKYKNLFADQGAFDIPANFTVGAAVKATPDITVAVDYQHISYSGVPSISNASNDPAPGFGWTDVNVWKLGAQWQATPKLTMRAGINVGDNPIRSRDVQMNIMAPGVITTHYTVGGTYALSKDTELTMSYMNAPSNSVSGLAFPGPVPATIKMSQQSLGIQFGWKF